jgi:hypothetical protein
MIPEVTISGSLGVKLAYMLAHQFRSEVENLRELGLKRGTYYRLLCEEIREVISGAGERRAEFRAIFRDAFQQYRLKNGGAA